MPRPLTPADIDDIVERYRAGIPMEQLVGEHGVSLTWGYHLLKRRGIPAPGRKRTDIDTAELVRLYESGESALSLSKRFGIARTGIEPRLIAAGISLRSQSEAERLKWERMSPEARAQQVANAHRSQVGKKHTHEHRAKGAATRENLAKPGSQAEELMRTMLADLGIETVRQKALGRYNVDLGAEPVAVELFGGGWHGYGRHARCTPKRSRYILDSGWNLLIIWHTRTKMPITVAAACDAAAYIERSRSDPSLRGEYRVIRGDGQFVAAGKDDVDQLTRVPSFS